jgi:hypothetical protein
LIKRIKIRIFEKNPKKGGTPAIENKTIDNTVVK